eukprot:c12836_g1_i3.p1 GENE.c12836_g1_i3~~c12836_g1_i3.p1  ORF type:complete len:127 (-),score=24.22 c12836_g1_i3:146-526(-)
MCFVLRQRKHHNRRGPKQKSIGMELNLSVLFECCRSKTHHIHFGKEQTSKKKGNKLGSHSRAQQNTRHHLVLAVLRSELGDAARSIVHPSTCWLQSCSAGLQVIATLLVTSGDDSILKTNWVLNTA